jgi:predicted N-acetyltransferase YhbS
MDNNDQQKINGITIRRLTEQDFEVVVALDAATVGHPRTSYFQRRLKTALSQPALHIQFGAEREGKLVGFVMARQMQGQFGRAEPALRLEAIGSASDERGQGIGSELLSVLEDEARRLKVPEIRTTASWRDHAIMQFFDHAGFELGDELVVGCQVADQRFATHDDSKVLAPAHLTGFSSTETDYSTSKGNDFEELAHDKVDLRTLKAEDMYDIVRIDKKIIGRQREAYIYELVDEAMNDSAVRVSLVARVDGIAVGFIMARTDFGDYGRAEPVAVLDTIGVAPDYSRHGIGHALLSQLLVNLDGLRVERVETVTASKDFQMLKFFYGAGFKPSQRLSFIKRVS